MGMCPDMGTVSLSMPLSFAKLRDKLLSARTQEQTGKLNYAAVTAAVAPFC